MAEKSPVFMILFLSLTFTEVTLAETTEIYDPMRPANYHVSISDNLSDTKEIETESWKLTAVLLSQDRSVAVINGKLLQPGEMLEGYQLVRIFRDKVVLKNKQQELILHRTGTGLKTKTDRRQ